MSAISRIIVFTMAVQNRLFLTLQMYPIVLYAGQVVVLLLGDHEGGQVGGIGGQEDEGEERPDVGEEFAGDATRRVGGHSRSEQHGPHQPECPKQRKPVLCHTTIVRLKMMKKKKNSRH